LSRSRKTGRKKENERVMAESSSEPILRTEMNGLIYDLFLCVETCGDRRIPRSTQPCIPPGSLNRVPASAGVKAGKSPLPGGR